jgi:hypothetical protein
VSRKNPTECRGAQKKSDGREEEYGMWDGYQKQFRNGATATIRVAETQMRIGQPSRLTQDVRRRGPEIATRAPRKCVIQGTPRRYPKKIRREEQGKPKKIRRWGGEGTRRPGTEVSDTMWRHQQNADNRCVTAGYRKNSSTRWGGKEVARRRRIGPRG